MSIKKLGANERCPCGSGKKHKRCCAAQGLPWYVDHKGRRLPRYVANHRDVKDFFSHKLRDEVIDHAEDQGGILDAFTPTTHLMDVYEQLGQSSLSSVYASFGFPSDVILLCERIGDMIPDAVYEEWKKSGVIVSRIPLPDDYREKLIEALAEVIDLYGVREMIQTDDGPVPCTFETASILTRLPTGDIIRIDGPVPGDENLPADMIWPRSEGVGLSVRAIPED